MHSTGQPGSASYGHLDPNAAYYYGHMDPSTMQGRPQGPVGWPPQGYPSGPSGVGAPPPVYHAGMRPSTPMRPPLPQQMMQGSVTDEQQRYEEQQRQQYFQQQQAAYAAQQQQQQLPRAATPSSALQIDGPGSQSRAPSVGSTVGAATPDSGSRHSTVDESNHGRASTHSQGSNVTPPASMPSGPSQQPSVPYYGHTQMYTQPSLRPPGPGTMQMKPGVSYMPPYAQSQQSSGYPNAHYNEGFQSLHPGMPQHMYQQQMWASQQAQRYPGSHANVSTSSSMAASQMSTPMISRPSSIQQEMSVMQQQQQQQQAYASRRPPYCLPTPGAPPGAPSPGPNRMRYASPSGSGVRQPLQAQYPQQSLMQSGRPMLGGSSTYPHVAPSTSTGLTGMLPGSGSAQSSAALNASAANAPGGSSVLPHPSFAQYVQPQPMQFPAGSVEATTISQRRRRKLLAKDLIGANTKRITMALRSGLDTEVTWALNALNVLLYDDSAPPTMLSQSPGLLNVLVEHFRALLSSLYSQTFRVVDESKIQSVNDENSLSDFWTELKKSEPTFAQPLVAPRSSKNEPTNFTKISRTGRTVHYEDKDIPERLRREWSSKLTRDTSDETLSPEYYTSRLEQGLGGETSSYLATRLASELEFKANIKRPKFFAREKIAKTENFEDIDSEIEKPKCGQSGNQKIQVKKESDHENCNSNVEAMVVRPTALCVRDESRLQIVRRCLAVSNVLRGLSFLPGNEGPMARHADLLFIIGRLLRLYTDEVVLKVPESLIKQLAESEETLQMPEIGTLSEANRRLVEPGDLLESDDDQALLLFETAIQLREDAFVIMTHISVQLDLFEFDSDISWPIFDALIHWCVSKSAEARDPLIPGIISPRCYALETLCKMSVIERNVDLLLSTGPWSRLEKFFKVLVGLLSLSEETASREFAIVILHAVCLASDQACYVVAAESPAIHSLVCFLEMGDTNMHQIAQNHGIQALRENPEMMGTSVPMLRRAASILNHLCRVPACRKFFKKYQHRLLQFTMSHLMDSRVGQTITDVLFAMQLSIWEDEVSVKKDNENSDDSNKEGTSNNLASKGEKNGANKATFGKCDSKDIASSEERTLDCSEVSRVDASELNLTDDGPPPAKKQRLENGVVKQQHLSKSNGGSTTMAAATPLKPLVNGDVKTVNSLQTVSRSTPTTPAGSVQAVA